MTTTAPVARLDPYAEARPASPARFLHGLNPVAKIAAPLPVMVALIFTRGIEVPLILLVLTVVLLLVGARLTPRAAAIIVLGTPIAVAFLGVSFGIWVDQTRLPDSAPLEMTLFSIGNFNFSLAAYIVGVASALRIVALIVLALIAGLTTTGPELIRALVQNLHLPYRVGYAALAAFRFVPRFGQELEVIRAAHRVRGTHSRRGPIAATQRAIGYIIPLLASAIRHAERVALAMDSRAFGAHASRTERFISLWRTRDTVFVIAFWLVSAAVYLLAAFYPR